MCVNIIPQQKINLCDRQLLYSKLTIIARLSNPAVKTALWLASSWRFVTRKSIFTMTTMWTVLAESPYDTL